jgi:hypothetical protein
MLQHCCTGPVTTSSKKLLAVSPYEIERKEIFMAVQENIE